MKTYIKPVTGTRELDTQYIIMRSNGTDGEIPVPAGTNYGDTSSTKDAYGKGFDVWEDDIEDGDGLW